MGISGTGRFGPLLICGLDSSAMTEAEYFVSVLRDLGRIVPVFVGADNLLKTSRFMGVSMLLVTGWEAQDREARLLEDFRKAFPDKPVVVLGRRNCPRIRMEAFVKGTDNYISPDCTEAEIEAKARRLWRLVKNGAQNGEQKVGMKNAPIKMRSLEIWLEEMVVLQNGRPVPLSQRELAMLIYLAKKHPSAVSRQTLEREVFGCRGDPGTNVVAVHIHRLRKKISPDGDILRTIPGGYQLN